MRSWIPFLIVHSGLVTLQLEELSTSGAQLFSVAMTWSEFNVLFCRRLTLPLDLSPYLVLGLPWQTFQFLTMKQELDLSPTQLGSFPSGQHCWGLTAQMPGLRFSLQSLCLDLSCVSLQSNITNQCPFKEVIRYPIKFFSIKVSFLSIVMIKGFKNDVWFFIIVPQSSKIPFLGIVILFFRTHFLTYWFSFPEIMLEKLPKGKATSCFLLGWIIFSFVIFSGEFKEFLL